VGWRPRGLPGAAAALRPGAPPISDPVVRHACGRCERVHDISRMALVSQNSLADMVESLAQATALYYAITAYAGV